MTEETIFDSPCATVAEEREPLPVFDNPSQFSFDQHSDTVSNEQEPLPAMGFSVEAPQFEEPAPTTHPEVVALADAAFGKSLAATIMAWFPICSIVSIFFGLKGLKLSKQARELAAQYNVEAGGKNTAARIMGMVGSIAGCVVTLYYLCMSVFWLLYMFIYMSAIYYSFS